MSNNNILSKPKDNHQEKMLNTDLLLKTKYISQEQMFQENKLDEIKLSVTRLIVMSGVWAIFFILYNMSDFDNSTLPVIIICFLAVYVVLELFVLYNKIKYL